MGDDDIYVEDDELLDDGLPENTTEGIEEVVAASSDSSSKKEDNKSESKKDSKSSSNNEVSSAAAIKAIVDKENKEAEKKKDDFNLINRIHNASNKNDSLELLLLIEDIIYKFQLAVGTMKEEQSATFEASARLKNAEEALKEYIIDMKRIKEESADTTRFLKELLSSFQNDVTQMVQEIDLTPMQRGIMQNISDILSKMPINEVNQSVSTLKTLVESLIKSIGIYKEDAEKFDEKLYQHKQDLYSIIKGFKDQIKEIKEEKEKLNGKRFGIATLISVLAFGVTLGSIASVYIYQDFFGQKFDEIAMSIQSNSNNSIRLKNDSGGKYFIYDKKTMEMKRVPGSKQIKIYIK